MPRLTIRSISEEILAGAAGIGDDLWQDIKQSAELFSRGYAQSLVDIARAVAVGDMSREEGESAAKAASFFFYMMIAQNTQATLTAIQRLMNAALGVVRHRINALLPVPVL
jgi:hypothetical protein